MRSKLSLPVCLLVSAVVVLSGCLAAPDGGAQSAEAAPLKRGICFVSVREQLEGAQPDGLNVSQHLLERQMLQHGFQLAKSKDDARFVLDGDANYTYFQELTMTTPDGRKQTIEHQYHGEFLLTLTDREAPKPSGKKTGSGEIEEDPGVEVFEIPKFMNGRNDRELAKRDIRRSVATLMCKKLILGRLLGNPPIRSLISSLGDSLDPRTFNEIAAEFVKLGRPAVPYLLDVLLDERPVKMSGSYAGLADWNKESLCYYHIADMALENILARESPLTLDSTEELYKKVITGWHWAWDDVQKIPEPYLFQPELRNPKVTDPKVTEPKVETPAAK
ncbi:MAG: hypothetical protein ACKVX7_11035 [Planctomycetota bacterium]